MQGKTRFTHTPRVSRSLHGPQPINYRCEGGTISTGSGCSLDGSGSPFLVRIVRYMATANQSLSSAPSLVGVGVRVGVGVGVGGGGWGWGWGWGWGSG